MLQRLQISGIRSFSPNSEVTIEFDEKLTLILGKNGVGKTTIIECLKCAATGVFPPGSENGKCFIHEPKLDSSSEVLSSIKLSFLTQDLKPIKVARIFNMIRKNDKLELKKTENIIFRIDDNDNLVQKNLRVAEMDSIVPELMNLNPAILQYVCFCHQDECLWPFGDSSLLKKIFDQIFCTEDFSKAQDIHKKFLKDKKKTLMVKKEELAWAMRQINQDRMSKEKLNKCHKDLYHLEAQIESLRQECAYFEDLNGKLKRTMALWDTKQAKTRELQVIQATLESFKELQFQDIEELDENRETQILSRKTVLVSEQGNIKLNLKALDKDICDYNQTIGQTTAEINLYKQKSEKKHEILKMIENISETNDHISTVLDKLEKEYKNAKILLRDQKSSLNDKQNSFKAKVFEINSRKKKNETEVFLNTQRLSELKSINHQQLTAEIQVLQQKCTDYSVCIKDNADLKEILRKTLAGVEKDLEKNKKLEVLDLKETENKKKLLEIKNLLYKMFETVPELKELSIFDYENHFKSLISRLESEILNLNNEIWNFKNDLGHKCQHLKEIKDKIEIITLTISNNTTDALSFSAANQINYTNLPELEQNTIVLYRKIHDSIEYQYNQTAIKQMLEKSKETQKCEVCESFFPGSLIEKKIKSLEETLKQKKIKSETAEAKKREIKKFLELCRATEALTKSLESLEAQKDATIDEISKFECKIRDTEVVQTNKNQIKTLLQSMIPNFATVYKIISMVESLDFEMTNIQMTLTSLSDSIAEIDTEFKLLCEEYQKSSKDSESQIETLKFRKKALKQKVKSIENLNNHLLDSQKSENLLTSSIKKLESLNSENQIQKKTKTDLETQLKSNINEINSLNSTLDEIKNIKLKLKNYQNYQDCLNKCKILKSQIDELSLLTKDFEISEIDKNNQALLEKKIEIGKTEQIIESTTKEILELERLPPNSEENAMSLYIETELLEKNICEHSILLKSLNSAVISYHQQKIFEINSIISKLWSETYKGNDIETIMINTDVQPVGKRSCFNYRICFRSKNCDVDMRGRCSSGQKMMASLVIRIALAQAFSSGFTVIALDEPTTNMDSYNSDGLAESISYLASHYEKLQLIIITHDQDFMRKIIRKSPRESYLTIEKSKNFSMISKITIE